MRSARTDGGPGQTFKVTRQSNGSGGHVSNYLPRAQPARPAQAGPGGTVPRVNAARGWQLWVWEEVGARVVEVPPGGDVLLAQGARVRLGREPEAVPGLSAARGANVFLNDVQLLGDAELRPGDLVRVGAVEAVVRVQSEARPRTERGLRTRAELEARLVEAVARAEPVGWVLVHGNGKSLGETLVSLWPRWLFAQVGPESFEGLGLTFDAPPELEARVGLARLGEDAWTADGLRARALERLAGEAWAGLAEAPVAVDPVMVRLAAWLERAARVEAPSPVVFSGEEGTGRALWARRLLSLRAGDAGDVQVVDARRGVAEVEAALEREGPLLVRGADGLPPDVVARVMARGACATVEKVGASWSGASVVPVPALRDRPAEVLPLAQRTLEVARGWLGRRSLAFDAEARESIRERPWYGNVRALQTTVFLAAMAAETDEIRVENLPEVESSGAHAAAREPDLRQTLRAAEKDVLLAALGRSRWNVSQTARELGLPRRTVVYRMSKLGLKRPS